MVDSLNKQTIRIEYIGNFVGADIPNDLVRTSIVGQSDPLDVSASPIQTLPGNADSDGSKNEPLSSGSEVTVTLLGNGASELVGRFDRNESYSVTIDWVTKDGNILFQDEVVSPSSGEQKFSVEADYPRANVRIIDEAGIDKPVTYAVSMR